jgi:hypothetical protein
MFGDGQGDAGNVDLLKGVGADHRVGNLCRHGDDGHGVHDGRGDPGDKVRRPWSRGCQADPYLARGAGIAVGRMGGGLLMAHEDVMNLGVLGKGVE